MAAPVPRLTGRCRSSVCTKVCDTSIRRHWDAKLAQLIRLSWAADPKSRPSFAAVIEQLNEVYRATVGTSYENSFKKAGGADGGAAGCCLIM